MSHADRIRTAVVAKLLTRRKVQVLAGREYYKLDQFRPPIYKKFADEMGC